MIQENRINHGNVSFDYCFEIEKTYYLVFLVLKRHKFTDETRPQRYSK